MLLLLRYLYEGNTQKLTTILIGKFNIPFFSLMIALCHRVHEKHGGLYDVSCNYDSLYHVQSPGGRGNWRNGC